VTCRHDAMPTVARTTPEPMPTRVPAMLPTLWLSASGVPPHAPFVVAELPVIRRRTLEHITAVLDMYALNLATPAPVVLRCRGLPTRRDIPSSPGAASHNRSRSSGTGLRAQELALRISRRSWAWFGTSRMRKP